MRLVLSLFQITTIVCSVTRFNSTTLQAERHNLVITANTFTLVKTLECVDDWDSNKIVVAITKVKVLMISLCAERVLRMRIGREFVHHGPGAEHDDA